MCAHACILQNKAKNELRYLDLVHQTKSRFWSKVDGHDGVFDCPHKKGPFDWPGLPAFDKAQSSDAVQKFPRECETCAAEVHQALVEVLPL